MHLCSTTYVRFNNENLLYSCLRQNTERVLRGNWPSRAVTLDEVCQILVLFILWTVRLRSYLDKLPVLAVADQDSVHRHIIHVEDFVRNEPCQHHRNEDREDERAELQTPSDVELGRSVQVDPSGEPGNDSYQDLAKPKYYISEEGHRSHLCQVVRNRLRIINVSG